MIVADGSEIGTIWIERDSSLGTTGDLGILIFNPIFRGQGLGREAIHLAERDAAGSWAVDLVILRVRASNSRAISCYHRCGYEISTVAHKEIDGVTVQVLQMEHRLSISTPQQAEQDGGGNSAALRASPGSFC